MCRPFSFCFILLIFTTPYLLTIIFTQLTHFLSIPFLLFILLYSILSCPILSYPIHLSRDLFLFVSLLLYSTFQDGRFFLQDKRSSNGTMVYLQEPLELPFSHPIRLRMGRSTLSIQVTLYISDMTLSPSPIRHLKIIIPLSLPKR